MAMGTVAILFVSGIAFTLMSSSDVSAADETPIVTVDEETTATNYALTANVMCRVAGTEITLTGVNVTVYTVNITEDENTMTIVIEKVAQGLTDSEGNITFDLPEGEYMVCATYQGLCGFGQVNLTEDQMSAILLHGGNWNNMTDQRMSCMNDGTYRHEGGPREMLQSGTDGANMTRASNGGGHHGPFMPMNCTNLTPTDAAIASQ